MCMYDFPKLCGIVTYCIIAIVLLSVFLCFSMTRMCCEAVGIDHILCFFTFCQNLRVQYVVLNYIFQVQRLHLFVSSQLLSSP